MTLFAPDLYRNFFIGFIGGALILASGVVEGIDGYSPEIVTRAQAAETPRPIGDDIEIAEEFLILVESEVAPQ